MFRQLTPVTKWIIIINAVLFVVSTYVFPNLFYLLSAYFPTSPNFKSWQIITHMFIHGGFMHLIFNMMTLMSFGPVLEQTLGEKKFLIFYFLCGLGSFLLFNAWNYYQIFEVTQTLTNKGINVLPIYENANIFTATNAYMNSLDADSQHLFSLLATPMMGASGAIFGVVAAFAVLFPNAGLYFMFIPFPVKAKYLLPIIILGSLFLGIKQFSGDNIAHFAHLGGALVGFIWIKNWLRTHRIR